MVRFNPPPGWPVPVGWSPTRDWLPDPAWPPAPPGWVFWVDESAATDGATDGAPESPPGRSARLAQRWRFPITIAIALFVTAGLGLSVLVVLRANPPLSIRTQPIHPLPPDLTGTAIQFDFGFDAYRVATYPDDSGHELAPAQLDDQWHDIEVTIDVGMHTLVVDGQTVVHAKDGGGCGNPILRVWAGSAEFADFSFMS